MNRNLSRRQDLAPLFRASDFFNLSPFSLMRRLSDDMERAFSEVRGEGGPSSSNWIPPIEVSRRENQLIVCAELPGIKPEDVHVEITDEGLVLQGERRQEETKEDERGFRRTERQYGSFYRVIPLPENVDPQQANANYRDGLLEITIPLPEPQQPKRREIPIQGASQGGQQIGGQQQGEQQSRQQQERQQQGQTTGQTRENEPVGSKR